MQKIPGLIILLFIGLQLQGQKLNNVWPFGLKGGLNFNTSPPTTFKSKSDGIIPEYYITSICDSNGQMKLYTDGAKVWNRDGFEMPRYNNWWPWSDRTLPLFMPYPGSDTLYYLFGISNGVNANKLLALTIRLMNAGDLEEVIYPQPLNQTSYYSVLTSQASLLLAGTAHCNQKDQWIVTQTPGKLEAFPVTTTGISSAAVVSAFPAIIPAEEIKEQYSNMKFSANGEKLVLPVAMQKKILVFDFDNQTGVFSNPLEFQLKPEEYLEDVELSPDGSKLYLASYYNKQFVPGEPGPDHHSVLQLDLEGSNPAQIMASAFKVNGLGENVSCIRTCIQLKRTMQLGPDGKIYMNMRYTGGTPNLDHTISLIEDPNKKGLDCRYRKNRIDLKKIYRFINYNYVRSSSYSVKENGIQVQQNTCADQPVRFKLLFSQIDSVKWNFGDPASNGSNTSAEMNPQHLYPGPGTYQVSAVIYRRCKKDTAYKEVRVVTETAIKLPAFIGDTLACKGTKFSMDVSVPGATEYQWDNGLIFPKRVFDTGGKFFVTVYNNCSVDRKEFKLQYQECPCEVWTPNAFTPNRDGLNDHFKPMVQCAVQDYELKIFHRWGGVVFQSKEINEGWTGRHGQSDAPAGVYVWLLKYRNPNTGVERWEKGTVTLIR